MLISFYIPNDERYLGGKNLSEISLDDHTFFISSERAWLVQTFLYLKRKIPNLVASDRLIQNAVNVIHCDEMIKIHDFSRYFTVVIVADRRVYLGGNLCIVQNYNQMKSGSDLWVMHWPQANLIKSARFSTGDCNKLNIGFLGLQYNSIDIEKVISHSKYRDRVNLVYKGPGEWHDYADLDIVVAVRSFNSRSDEKPPTKLLNAWRAGVAFIGGNDSAYEQIGRPGVNYVQVSSFENLLESLDLLCSSQEVRRRYVEEGFKAAEAYTYDNITARWIDIFECAVKFKFNRWCNSKGKTFLLRRRVLYQLMRTKRFILRNLNLA